MTFKKIGTMYYLQSQFSKLKIVLLSAIILFAASCKNSNSTSVLDAKFTGNGDALPKVTQEMVAPPMLPKFDQVDKDGPKVVQVTFTVEEKKIECRR